MLVECRGQALAICRISVAELRRVAPPAFYLLMVASLLLADGLLPVLAVKLRTEAALYSGGLTARSSNSNGNTFIGGDWPAAAASSSAHAMATGNVRTQSNHKRTRVKTYVPTLAGNADGKSKHHYTVVSNSHDVAAIPSPQSYVSSATPTPVTSHRSTPPASSSSSSSSSSTHPLVCSSNGTKDIFFLPLKDPNIFSRGSISDAPPSVNKKCIVLTNDTVPDFCAGRRLDMRLQFCSAYKVSDVYDTKTSNCSEYLLGIIDKDKWVEKHFEGFRDIIKRYDCRTKYSVKWDCYRCKLAYKDWLCSNNFTYFHSGQSWQPCSELCESVEERCPFFRPEVKTQAGDPSFICKDHHMNLPDTYQDKPCYRTCHLWWGDDYAENEYCRVEHLPKSNCSLFYDPKCVSPDDTFTVVASSGSVTTAAAAANMNNNNSSSSTTNVTSSGPQNGTSHPGVGATSSSSSAMHSCPATVVFLRVALTLLCLTLSQFRYLITELT